MAKGTKNWFRHSVSAHSNFKIASLIKNRNLDCYAAYFIIVELVAAKLLDCEDEFPEKIQIHFATIRTALGGVKNDKMFRMIERLCQHLLLRMTKCHDHYEVETSQVSEYIGFYSPKENKENKENKERKKVEEKRNKNSDKKPEKILDTQKSSEPEKEEDFSYSDSVRKALNKKQTTQKTTLQESDTSSSNNLYFELSEKFLRLFFNNPYKSQIEKTAHEVKIFIEQNNIDLHDFSKAIDNKLTVMFDPLVFEGYKKSKSVKNFLEKFDMYSPDNFDIKAFYDLALCEQVESEKERERQIQLSSEFSELCKRMENQ